jgi:hypothetical protein
MKFVVRLFLLVTLIVSFLLETVGSAISFHKCIQPIIVECGNQEAKTEACCCEEDGNISDSNTLAHSSKSSSVNFENVGFDCCKEVNSYFNIPVYQVAQIFVPSSKVIDLHSEIGFLKFDDFPVLISNFVFRSNYNQLEAPPNEHLAVFCVFQI